MSGFKHAVITITREEYEHLLASDHLLRSIPAVHVQEVSSKEQKRVDALQGGLRDLEKRQARYQHLLAGLDENVRRVERTTSQAIARVEADSYRAAQAAAGQWMDQFQAFLADRDQKTQAVLAENQEKLQFLSERMDQEFGLSAQHEARKQAAALEWITASEDLAQFIAANYHCELDHRETLDACLRSLELARQNESAAMYEAAVQAGQQAYLSLSDVRGKLEILENERRFLILHCCEAVDLLLAQAEASEYVQAYDLEGAPLPYEILVDFWTRGQLAGLREELVQWQAYLAGPTSSFALADLQEWSQETIPGYRQRLADMLLDARIRALNSQLRINIADLVVQALNQQGFALQRADYCAQDTREPFQAELQNYEGDAIVVEVLPTGEALGENELALHSLDGEIRTENELRFRWHKIHSALAQYGLNIGHLVEEAQSPYQTAAPSGLPARRPVRKNAGQPAQTHVD